MLLDSDSMSDKELNAVISNHRKKLDNMEALGKFMTRKIKQNFDTISQKDSSPSNSSRREHWNDNSFTDESLNLSNRNLDWKGSPLYSMPNSSQASCSILYSKIYPDNVNVQKKNLIFNLEVEKNKKYNGEEKKCLLYRIRNRLAYFQASQGISDDQYTFATLIKNMGQITAKSLLALFYFIINVIPMTLILLYILRFILDKVIDIKQMKDRQQIAVQTMFLGLQLSFIYLCLSFIFGIIWLPTFQIVMKIISSCLINPTYN
ncbi:uncharacterized protein [Chelonus insularis]|uniref:uncharacterized protein isoform X2 n=1 Tax=Chelonus insularis TaxID=460826 RepID=UPI001589F86E|nr:uncharacterized protein LOC118073480 isoform X2 [Chelonus insularis]